MSRKLILIGVICFAAAASGKDLRLDDKEADKGKEPEKKPNIVKDYVCLRDGDLCHPDSSKGRGRYVSCANGVAWELECPRCTYHPLTCPTKTLWFDGERCDWASPKLASQPCMDQFPAQDMIIHNSNVKEESVSELSEQEALFQSLQVAPAQMSMSPQAAGVPSKEQQYADKNKWPMNPMSVSGPPHFKSPKSGEMKEEVSQAIDEQDVNESIVERDPFSDIEHEAAPVKDVNDIERNAPEDVDQSFPSYLNPEDNPFGSKVVRFSDPVYTLVNHPDGSGKQVLMKVAQPFVLEDSARSVLPNTNTLNYHSEKN